MAYIPAQVAGCVAGAVIANAHVLARPPVSHVHQRPGSPAHFLSEIVATVGLMPGHLRLGPHWPVPEWPPAAVGAYIGAAYFFTSSTSFANPAITVGRMFSNTFAGIAPSSVPSFVVAQVVGGAVAVVIIKVLYPDITAAEASDIMVPHHLAVSSASTDNQ